MNPPSDSPAVARTSGLALVGCILGVASCGIALALISIHVIYALVGLAPVLVWHGAQILTAVAAVVLGVLGLRQIAGQAAQGRRLALAGISIGILTTVVIMPLVLYARVIPTVKEGQWKSDSMRKLKRIVDALHKYHDEHSCFPPAQVFNKKGEALLSWRVLLLPYLGHDKLYQRFKLDEAWDSTNNMPLLTLMPDVYAPLFGKDKDFTTYCMVFDGPGATFHTTGRPAWFDDEMNRARTPGFQVLPQRPGEQPIYNFGLRPRLIGISDGPANTILVVKADDRIPWTKPQDLPYDDKETLPQLGGHYHGDFVVAMADGAVRVVSKRVSERSIRDAITNNGGEVPQADWLEP